MNKITSADVSAWLKEQLTALHETHEYASITVEINQYRGHETAAKWSVYTGSGQPQSDYKPSLEDCIADMATQTPKSIAQQKRERAAALMAEADEIETQNTQTP
jgi:hypothetical protein